MDDGFMPTEYMAAGLWMYALKAGVHVEADLDDLRIFPLTLDKGLGSTTKDGSALSVFSKHATSVRGAREELYDLLATSIDAEDLLYRTDAANGIVEAELRAVGGPVSAPAVAEVELGVAIVEARGASSDRRGRQSSS
jgi:hypothetical protein